MHRNQGSLSPRKHKAVLGLTEKSIAETARQLQIPERTLYRWMKQPLFAAVLRDERRAKYSQDSTRLAQMRPAASSILGKTMVDPHTPPATKVKAAATILNQTKISELEDIETRVAELERAAEAAKGDKNDD